MKRRDPAALLLLLALGLLARSSAAELRLAALLADGMVIQRQVPVPVWGWAAAGAEVAVSLGGQARSTRAGAGRPWRIDLPPRAAGGPRGSSRVTVPERRLA